MKREKVFELYDKYNAEFFKGLLPEVEIVFADVSAFGYTIPHWSGFEVECIILAKGMTDLEIETTLAHEMIHVWQCEKGFKSWDHNKKLYKKAKKICKAKGWNLRTF